MYHIMVSSFFTVNLYDYFRTYVFDIDQIYRYRLDLSVSYTDVIFFDNFFK